MIIENASVKDAGEILNLQKTAFYSEAIFYNDFNIPPLLETQDSMEKAFDEYVILKGLIDGRIIASARVKKTGHTAYIGRVIVHPDFQNRGYGKAIMNAAEAVYPEAQKYFLGTGEKSERNLHFYQKLGYRITGSNKETEQVTLVIMEKNKSNIPAGE